MRSCSAALSILGLRRGRLDRSCRHTSDARCSGPASRQRTHHRWAVAGATLRAAAAARNVEPASISNTSSWRWRSVSFALP